MKNRLILTGLFIFIFSGCAMQRASQASRAQNTMVGMSKSDVLSCMGAPDADTINGDMEFMSYQYHGDSTSVGTGVRTGSVVGVGVSKTKQRSCKANVVLKQNVVTKVNYLGRTGGLLSSGEQCAYLVENCVQ